MKIESYVCDYCKEDINPNYGIRLHSIKISRFSEKPHEFIGDTDFCGSECMIKCIHSMIASINENGKEEGNDKKVENSKCTKVRFEFKQ